MNCLQRASDSGGSILAEYPSHPLATLYIPNPQKFKRGFSLKSCSSFSVVIQKKTCRTKTKPAFTTPEPTPAGEIRTPLTPRMPTRGKKNWTMLPNWLSWAQTIRTKSSEQSDK
jgi:hypothetical protein